jgi:BirA family biotin operon repressor/biotin-[acetyl-CoA-carboxylase] ligase
LNAEVEARPLDSFVLGNWRVERWAALGSTSDRARELALSGDSGRIWIVADEQLAGRGRQGRVWASPPGNFYASALLIDPCEAEFAPQLGFVAGVAVRRAAADLGVEARLKWPNDLVADGAKLAGLLVEGVRPPGRRLATMIGIGVNVVSSPEGLAYPTTSLSQCAGAPRTARALLERLARRFDEALAVWARGSGFARIRETWLASAAGLGGPIRVSNAHGAREGAFEGLDALGRLILNRNGVLETIESADITLIPTNPGAPQAATSSPSQ